MMNRDKVVIRRESLFSTYADAIVIPRSTAGTITDSIRKGLRDILGVEVPDNLSRNALGSLEIMPYANLHRENNLKPIFHLLFATSIDNNTSHYEAITKISRQIAAFTVNNPDVRDVAVPLLGTGTGGLDHFKVYDLLENNFIKNASKNAVLQICIDDELSYKLFRISRNVASASYTQPDISAEDHSIRYAHLYSGLTQDNFLPKPNMPSLKVASLINDADDCADYLDFQQDIDAFAKIMAAAAFKPPLAIALFGKWGSGKSFFMRKLMSRINEYSQLNNKFYCTGIAQIHFNAWSYLDANLWASMVSKIFEGLNSYIGAHTKASVEVKSVQAELIKKLSINAIEVNSIKKEFSDISGNIEKLTAQKEDIVDTLEKKKKELAEGRFSKAVTAVVQNLNVTEKIRVAISDNPSLKEIEKDITEIIPEEYLNDPEAAWEQAKSFPTYVKIFFNIKNVLWLMGIVLACYFMPYLLDKFLSWMKGSDFSYPPLDIFSRLVFIIPTLRLIWGTYKKLQPLVASLWQIKQQYDIALKDAEANFKKKDLILAAEIAAGEQRIAVINTELKEKHEEQTNLAYKKDHALSTETLYNFIGKRTVSDDYQRHLGLISLIRHDLEALSDLFDGHNQENKHKDFLSNFDHPLERIILYVDDLDRCPEDRVVEVLEAVNLLMAFPLFIVVVGVDPCWVRNALTHRYSAQFSGTGIDRIDASDYLEKIFQVPFHLRSASDKSIKGMIRTLSGSEKDFESAQNDMHSNENSSVEDGKSYPRVVASGSEDEGNAGSEQNPSQESEEEHLKLSTEEIILMQDMSVVLGYNPRAIKRFVNIYQVARVHEGMTYLTNLKQKELSVFMFLVALHHGCYRKVVPCFVNYMLGEDRQQKELEMFLQEHDNTPEEVCQLKTALLSVLLDGGRYKKLLETNMAIFKLHNAFIQRFSFN